MGRNYERSLPPLPFDSLIIRLYVLYRALPINHCRRGYTQTSRFPRTLHPDVGQRLNCHHISFYSTFYIFISLTARHFSHSTPKIMAPTMHHFVKRWKRDTNSDHSAIHHPLTFMTERAEAFLRAASRFSLSRVSTVIFLNATFEIFLIEAVFFSLFFYQLKATLFFSYFLVSR